MKKTILIIEDHPELCENIADILKLRSYLVLTAKNGEEGVKKALTSSPDMIICDIIMPELDGYGVLQVLNQYQATCQIPFIFLTAKSELPDLKRGMDLGADEYLVKPFEGTDLLNLVEISFKKSTYWKTNYGSQIAPLKKELCAVNGFCPDSYRGKRVDVWNRNLSKSKT